MRGLKLLVLSCVAVVALADLPRFRAARFRLQRQELASTTTESPIESTTLAEGPYPPSGWRPVGEPFTFPKQDTTETSPTDTYGLPNAPYSPSGFKPSQPFTLPQEQLPQATSYGLPDNTYGVPDDTNSTESVTDNPQAEKLDGPVTVQKSVGTYYVLLPNGQLQRVEFMTENDIQNMKYSARLQYQQPAPLFVFGP